MSLVMKNLSKHFDSADMPTLEGIDLEIQDGEFVSIVGRSGCGKSTLLNIVAGLDQPTGGEILLNGEAVTGPGADRTVMFQEHGLYPWLNVIDNVKFGMRLNGVPKEEQEARAEQYLKMVNLWEYRDYPIHQISGGMRQRTALARALTMDSQLLLMDEPFSALDKQTSNRLREELQNIWMETHKTIFFITHSVEEAVFLSDRVVVLCPEIRGVRDIVDISLERPRHVDLPGFVELRHKILEEVRGEEAL
ncbi:MAG: ABC transporter ATP-binding protein [Lachnospiraceae bacterium]|nr:ABC transporter ATP-binding protein [Lachnospiraceae bacterium]